ncbi:nitroreductase family protein [Desulfoprunum benzoelyticum]|uniref:Nitroreductase n=1 Tax=Desulfoprunum benzoelyticum TaxID=1506996 RepID=A0A840ULR6_9BACT|nr:nitroreductase family protein [Desulfoprunum benzoelyticum]MBB5346545.1 nitroreductase [Desulfoprunum benzoelyticum]MBM9528926.1 nitroreductase family protein [Desulfoprunum benzoelyticum]
MENSILKAIKERRSIREFTTEAVSEKDLVTLVEAAIWAPSGKNNQPWRFVILTDKKVRSHIADLTLYRHIVANCNSLIVVFLDTEAIYDEVKDHQSAGAAIQNILLAAESLGLGAVWLGQILKNKHDVNVELGVSARYDLMAVIAVGYPAHRNQKSHRKNVHDFILKKIGG